MRITIITKGAEDIRYENVSITIQTVNKIINHFFSVTKQVKTIKVKDVIVIYNYLPDYHTHIKYILDTYFEDGHDKFMDTLKKEKLYASYKIGD
jgi:hypothetical protein